MALFLEVPQRRQVAAWNNTLSLVEGALFGGELKGKQQRNLILGYPHFETNPHVNHGQNLFFRKRTLENWAAPPILAKLWTTNTLTQLPEKSIF